jgi:hypothetical protein
MKRFNFFVSFMVLFSINPLHAQSNDLLSVNEGLQKEIKTMSVKTVMNPKPNPIPQAFSLEKYLPPIGNQSDVGSCVGWATTYYALTFVNRVDKGIDTPPFSPWSTFNRYKAKKQENPCYGGARMYDCLDILKKQGAPYHNSYAFPYCSKDDPKLRYIDKLSGFKELQSQNSQQIKRSLVEGCPVVVGMKIFDGGKGNSLNSHMLDSNGVIKMECFRDTYTAGAHAMCIVGFDDQIDGGAFKLVNSWGEDWGKNGFCWLRYSDLKILICAYTMFPENYNPIKHSDSKEKVTSELHIRNKSKTTLLLSYSTNSENGRITKGWFTLPAKKESVIFLGDKFLPFLDLTLLDEHRNPMTVNGTESLKVHADIKRTFHYFGDVSTNMESEISFYRVHCRKNRKMCISTRKNDAINIR